MSVICKEIMLALDRLAPRVLAEEWDNVGLLIGQSGALVQKVLIVLDVTLESVEWAIKEKVDLIIAHHPLIFQPIKTVRTDLPLGNIIAKLIHANISVFALHTNLDVVHGGVNDALAEKLTLKSIKPLSLQVKDQLIKLAVYVPVAQAAKVRDALTDAGAGHIGNYSHCTFQTCGTGTFLPLPGSNPYCGDVGQISFTPECRIETVFPASLQQQVLQAMLAVHPYEEVAYDLYTLLNDNKRVSLGRVGFMGHPLTLSAFAEYVKQVLAISNVKIVGDRKKTINKVAVCGGSGASLIERAIAVGADVFVTGDIKYHEAQQAAACGLAIVDAGHFATEYCAVEVIAQYIERVALAQKWSLEVLTDPTANDIFSYV